MIPVVRGATTSLTEMVYGNEENGTKPNKQFIEECNTYPKLLETAMKIEGLICGRSVHASGVIIFEEPYFVRNCAMRAPKGQLVTQWNMDDSSYCGGLKYDYLTITNLDAMRTCLDLLIEYGKIEWQGSLRNTFNKYFHPDVIDYDTSEMWDWSIEGKIVNLFQFNTQVGSQAIKKIAPHSLTEIEVANAVMRLAAPSKNGEEVEQPLDTYVRYKNDISQWYDCMRNKYHLTEFEISIMEKYLKKVSGMATMQEEVMMLSMDEHISNFDMKSANKLRRGISKKKAKIQAEAKAMFYEGGKKVGASMNLLNYVWQECITPQLTYSFSLPHILNYSILAIQEMNMAYHYPIIYWNTANLIIDSGSNEELEDNSSTQYGRIAEAISNMQSQNVTIGLPTINEAKFGFVPDEADNTIIFAFKSLNGIGDDVARTLLTNRPYTSMEDFYTRMILPQNGQPSLIKTAQMVKLIKAGCFTKLDNQDRTKTMEHFLKTYVMSSATKLTMSQYNKIQEFDEKYHIIPDSINLAIRHKNFKDYVLNDCFFKCNYIDSSKPKVPKCGYHDRFYQLDNIAMKFFTTYYSEDSVVEIVGNNYVISEKKFKKENDKFLEELKNWFADENTIATYNECQFKELWEKYAKGSVSTWEMDSLCAYVSTPHELAHIDTKKYGIKCFNDLSEEPVPYDYYTRTINQTVNGVTERVQKQFPKYEISRLAGTVLDSDNNKHLLTVLCHDGVTVKCKFNKGQYVNYNRVISHIGEDGKKVTDEQSWFKRGSLVLLHGYRQAAQFRCYNYSDTVYKHTCNLITSIDENGNIEIATERMRLDE